MRPVWTARVLLGFFAVAVLPWSVRGAFAEPQSPAAVAEEDETVPGEVPSGEPLAGDAAPPVASASPSATVRDDMVHVPGRSFLMGSSDPRSPANERPRHLVSVSPFWIDRTEVTVGAYRACVESRACASPEHTSASCTYDAGNPRLPISCVHWRDADAFCRAVGKRLPREAEWELAGRGTSGRKYPWGTRVHGCFYAATSVGEMGARTCTKGPSPVGAHPMGATPSGIQDLAGNVEEWTADWYAENLALADVPAAGASHVLRGGGWLSPPSAARTTSRNWGSSVEAGPNVGFRCAKDEAKGDAKDRP